MRKFIFIFLLFYIFIPLGSFFVFSDTPALAQGVLDEVCCVCDYEDPQFSDLIQTMDRETCNNFAANSPNPTVCVAQPLENCQPRGDIIQTDEEICCACGEGDNAVYEKRRRTQCEGLAGCGLVDMNWCGRTQKPPSEPIEFTPQVTIPGSDSKFVKGEAQRITETTIGEYIRAVYNFIIGIVGILAVVMIMWGGFKWLTAAGNPGVIGNAQATIFNALIGLVLALGSYTLLYIINPNLVRFKSIVSEYIAAQPLLSPTEIIVGCDDCASMAGSIPCKSANNCRANRNLVDALKRLKQDPECGSGWRVTEGYPPTTQHRDRDHGNGRAVDIALSPPITGTSPTPAEQAKIDALYRCLQKHGFQSIANEYQRWYDTTTGNHFHIEWH